MDPILPTSTASSTAAAATSAGGAASEDRLAAASDFETFLTLLTAQLKNQDPMEPLDSTQFVAQLASFSTVEQLIGVNERLDALTGQLGGSDIVRLSEWIGHDVAMADGTFAVNGKDVTFPYQTLPGSERIEAVVTDSRGVILHRFTVTGEDGVATWDGRDGSGTLLADRELKIDLFHMRGDEVLEEERAAIFSRVVGVTDTEAGTQVILDSGRVVDPESVGTLRAPETAAG